MAVELRLLGPVDVWSADRLVPAGEPRRRAVLAALAVDAGQVVPSTTLIDRVWGADPPAQAAKTLSTHITRIRRVLKDAAGDQLPVEVVNQQGGYRLAVDRDLVDLHRFRRLVRQARDPGGPEERRLELLRQAMGLWRGQPLTGIPGAWADRLRDHLVREQLEATVAWAETELRTGDPAAVLIPLVELADEHPLMEPLTAVLVRALVAAGRPGEALERCRLHRRRLADEQGIDQGPELRALYAAILRGEERPAQPPMTAQQGSLPVARAAVSPRVPEVPVEVGSEFGFGPAVELAPPPSRSRRQGRWARRVGVGIGVGVVVALGAAASLGVPTWRSASGESRPAAVLGALTGNRQPTASDDFLGSTLNRAEWRPYQQMRANGSSWSPGSVEVADGELRIVATGRNPTGAGNVAGGANWGKPGGFWRQEGIWAIRAKFDAGSGYGPIIGLYPKSDHPADGMVTLARSDRADRRAVYPEAATTDGDTIQGPVQTGDFTDWTTYAVEWRHDFVKIYLNGKVIFDTRTAREPVKIPSQPMFLYIQVVPGPDGAVPATGLDTPDQVVTHVDWVRYYA